MKLEIPKMVIKSDFKDYYDGVSRYDEDRSLMYIRKSTEKELTSPIESGLPFFADEFAKYQRGYRDLILGVESVVFGIGGKVFPCIRFNNFLFTEMDSLCSYFESNYEIDLAKRSSVPWVKRKYSLPEFFETRNSTAFEAIFEKWNVPVLKFTHSKNYTWRGGSYEKNTMSLNPVLSGSGFEKIQNPHEVYDSVYRWLANRNNPGRPIPEMPNDIKIQQAGFDLKKSFRKEKSS